LISFTLTLDDELLIDSRLATVSGAPLSGTEELLAKFDATRLDLSATGGSLDYSVRFETDERQPFESENLTLGANETHGLVPSDWSDVDSSSVVLEIDFDSDGIPDEVRVLYPNRVYLPVLLRKR
jgi:hypothetical protein